MSENERGVFLGFPDQRHFPAVFLRHVTYCSGKVEDLFENCVWQIVGLAELNDGHAGVYSQFLPLLRQLRFAAPDSIGDNR